MSATTMTLPAASAAGTQSTTQSQLSFARRVSMWCSDTVTLLGRNLTHIRRTPMQLSDATIQPVLFTVMFTYIFGGSMSLPGGGTYKEFLIGGLIAMNVTTASVGSGVGFAADLSNGVMNRFRTLPMSRSSILVARTGADLFSSALCSVIVVITGLAIGWRAGDGVGIGGIAAGLGVAVLFAYAMSWITVLIGLATGDAESTQATGMMVLFPLAFMSSAFAPTQGFPAWMRTVATWNPVSAVAGAVRELFGNPNPAVELAGWPNQHPVAMSLLWSVAIVAIAVPLASRMLVKKTSN